MISRAIAPICTNHILLRLLACAATPGGAKKVPKLETGLEVQVPLFMKEGEIVHVNTKTAEVAGRA